MAHRSILFDESHSEVLKIGRIKTEKDWDSWSRLEEKLKKFPLKIVKNQKSPISQDLVKGVDIIVLGCPKSAFELDEISTLTNYVKDGGALLVLYDYGGDKRNKSNLSALTKEFGIEFRDDQINDDENNLRGYSYGPIISVFKDSPIIFNLDDFYYLLGCSLNVTKPARVIATSSDKSYRKIYSPVRKSKKVFEANSPVLAICELKGGGRVVALGDLHLFSDDDSGLIISNHGQLLNNILYWLIEGKLTNEEKYHILSLRISEVTREMSDLKRALDVNTVKFNDTREFYTREQLAEKMAKIERALAKGPVEHMESEKDYFSKRVKYEFYAILISIISMIAVVISIIISIFL